MIKLLKSLNIIKNEQSKGSNQLWIATLNYSGIIKSPFQFFSDSQLGQTLELISQKFAQIAVQYWPDFPIENCVIPLIHLTIKSNIKSKWPIGKIDVLFQTRYSPLYDQNCGIDQHYLLDNSKQFESKWLARYETFKQNQLILNNLKPFNEQEISMCIKFDLLCYHAILTILYKQQLDQVSTIPMRDKIIDSISGENGKKYAGFMKKSFSHTFIQSHDKIQKTLNMLKESELDVVFLQEADEDIVKAIQKRFKHYRISMNQNIRVCSSVILIHENSFENLIVKSLRIQNLRFFKNQNCIKAKNDRDKYQTFSKKELQQLNFNEKTVVQIIDQFIFISGHLTSKQNGKQGETNQEQVLLMLKTLHKLHEVYPTFQIVCGFDINSYLPQQMLQQYGFDFIYPNNQKFMTVNKKRTYLQPQIKKANQDDTNAKDFLFSTTQLHSAAIVTIDQVKQHLTNSKNKINQQTKPPLLPTDQHPYDHLMVVAKIEKSDDKEKNYYNFLLRKIQKNKYYSPEKLKFAKEKFGSKILANFQVNNQEEQERLIPEKDKKNLREKIE